MKLVRIAILAGMKLSNPWVKLSSEFWNTWTLECASCDNYVIRLINLISGGYDIVAALRRDRLYPGIQPYRETKSLGIGLQVIYHLIFQGKMTSGSRESHPRQVAVFRRREEPERIPPLPPRITYTLVSIENHKVMALL